MLPIPSSYGFASGYPESYALDESLYSSYAQGYFGLHPTMPGDWYPPAWDHEVSPWEWQWSRARGTQEFLFTHHSYAATITHPRVQPTCQPLPTFSRVVGGPISNTPRLEVICPRPTHPLPKWIDTTGWEDEEERFDLTPSLTSNVDDTDWENSSEELDDTRQSLPLCMLSPDADDLPPPFFPPSRGSTPAPRTLASLSPGACNPPQPRFDSNPHPPIFVVNTQPSGLVAAPQHSPRSDSLEPTMFPGAWDAPPLNFEIYAQFGMGMFSYPSLPGCHPDQVEVRGARDHTRRGLGKGLWKVDG